MDIPCGFDNSNTIVRVEWCIDIRERSRNRWRVDLSPCQIGRVGNGSAGEDILQVNRDRPRLDEDAPTRRREKRCNICWICRQYGATVAPGLACQSDPIEGRSGAPLQSIVLTWAQYKSLPRLLFATYSSLHPLSISLLFVRLVLCLSLLSGCLWLPYLPFLNKGIVHLSFVLCAVHCCPALPPYTLSTLLTSADFHSLWPVWYGQFLSNGSIQSQPASK